jgi:ankyrin repeat protein
MMTPCSAFEDDPLPLETRRGFEFTEELRWLHQSVNDKDYRRVSDILKSSKEPHVLANEAGDDGRTALHIAVTMDDLKISRLLIEHGAIVNAQDNNGDTPLHLAGGAPTTNLLLEAGHANPNIPNIDGICALHVAVQRRDSGSVRILLKHHAKVDTADNLRWLTPLHLVAMPDTTDASTSRARATIAELLCSVDDTDLNYQDSEGNTPLHYAVQIEASDAGDVINSLLEKGASPRIPNSRNQEPLLLLCHNNSLRNRDVFQESLHSMLYHGADPNRQSNTGATALHLSLFHKDVDSAVQLVNRAAELHLPWRKVRRTIVLKNEKTSSLF